MEKERKKRIKRTKADVTEAIRKAAIEQIVKGGFSSSIVTGIMKHAKIEPAVFYNRYKNIDEFYDEFVKEYDYWFSDLLKGTSCNLTSEEGYKELLTHLLFELQKDSVMLELLRWEVAEGNKTTLRTAMLRELHTMSLTNDYRLLFQDSGIDIVALSAIIIGGIYYLSLHKDRSPFCGIDLNGDEGFNRISKALALFSSLFFSLKDKSEENALIIERMRKHGISEEIIKDCVK